jgi:hypothetical protein
MKEQEIRSKIEDLKLTLTGNLLDDCETQNEIYQLKKKLSLETNIPIEKLDEDDEGCLYCGS